MHVMTFAGPAIGRANYYLRGMIFPIAGDFVAFRYDGNSASLAKNADNLAITLASARGWFYNTTRVDLTNISYILLYGSTSHATSTGTISIHTDPSTLSHLASATIPANNANALVVVDVRTLTGLHHIRTGLFLSGSMTVKGYDLYGVR